MMEAKEIRPRHLPHGSGWRLMGGVAAGRTFERVPWCVHGSARLVHFVTVEWNMRRVLPSTYHVFHHESCTDSRIFVSSTRCVSVSCGFCRSAVAMGGKLRVADSSWIDFRLRMEEGEVTLFPRNDPCADRMRAARCCAQPVTGPQDPEKNSNPDLQQGVLSEHVTDCPAV